MTIQNTFVTDNEKEREQLKKAIYRRCVLLLIAARKKVK